MSVGFHKIDSESSLFNETCPLCYDTMKDPVAHNGPHGDKHPWCVKCIKAWIQVSPKCPSCQEPLDNSLFTRLEIVKLNIKHLLKDAKEGACNQLKQRALSVLIIARAILGLRLLPPEFSNEEEQELRKIIRKCSIGIVTATVLTQAIAKLFFERNLTVMISSTFVAGVLGGGWLGNVVPNAPFHFVDNFITLTVLTNMEMYALENGINHGIVAGITTGVVTPIMGLIGAMFVGAAINMASGAASRFGLINR